MKSSKVSQLSSRGTACPATAGRDLIVATRVKIERVKQYATVLSIEASDPSYRRDDKGVNSMYRPINLINA